MHVSEDVEAALLAHPAVARLDGVFSSCLPGRRVVGVRVEERVEVAVVLRLGHPIPEVVAELRERVGAVAGPVPVDVVVADLVDA
ncbi:hypothetical protein [Saccharothrix syringae]|uniref:Asp23/Gls24 family envelope stress response protein n=1 Tax=Saccharothrix syringae TaxID=103733 RepID=A0A5Q0GWC5_SACSY|nr:hypothetical protein [Saccharothrix syringae]QFZ17652.1 hypothetical protein EKG83_09300 [Saccharothrix syringae]